MKLSELKQPGVIPAFVIAIGLLCLIVVGIIELYA